MGGIEVKGVQPVVITEPLSPETIAAAMKSLIGKPYKGEATKAEYKRLVVVQIEAAVMFGGDFGEWPEGLDHVFFSEGGCGLTGFLNRHVIVTYDAVAQSLSYRLDFTIHPVDADAKP